MSAEKHLFSIYRDLLPLFPDDLHLARPLIQMLQQAGRRRAAADLALHMARRMQSAGRYSEELGFLAICRQLEHPDREAIKDMESMARIMVQSGGMEGEQEPGRVFSLIEQLSDLEARDFLLQGSYLSVERGRAVVAQGEVSQSFFLIVRGSMDVELETGGNKLLLANLKAGDYFGEFACIYRIPRSATVRAHEDARLLRFSDRAIHDLIERSPIAGERLMQVVQRRMVQSLTFEHPAFAELAADDRLWLAESSTVREYQAGEFVCQDCAGDDWLIMIHGRQEWVVDLKPAGAVAPHTMVYGGSRFLRREGTMIRAVGHTLVCDAPPAIFASFMQAYAGFERWVKEQKAEPASGSAAG
ncbi:MAG: cyclic nucleotide-binding domain-containing protein [Zetaproteobacteria bacterium]|nr:MAG: cyclic nucleotide-binding domain-containing protein [Zetaproteobacteria bacterium]